jgi:3-oxoadipate enol-lactonase
VHLSNYSAEYFMVGEGEPLVLVPGLAGGFELLGRLARVLARDFQVISYQLRGERAHLLDRRTHTMAGLADDLAELQDALVLERPAVAGVSFGAAVALEFALRHSRRVGPLILNGVESRFRNSLGGHIARLALEEFPLPHDNPFFNQFFRVLFARREQVGRLLDFVTERCWSTDQSLIAHRLRLLTEFDASDRLTKLTMPALVIAGADDSVVRPDAQRALCDAIPDAQFATIPAAGHLCFLTRPHAFLRHVARFVASLRTPVRRAA